MESRIEITMSNREIGPGHGRGRVHRLAPGRGPAEEGYRGPRGRQPGHGPPLEPGPSRGPIRVDRGRPGRLRRLPTGRRGGRLRLPPGGDPERPPVGPRAARVARSGPTATLNMLEAARQAGVRRFMFAASSSAYGDTVELPKHEGMMPTPAEPLRRRQARRRALRQRLRPDDGPRRRQPALLQRLRPAAGPVEPLQRRDLALHQVHVAGPAADDLRRRPADPRLHLRRQRRGRQPRRDARPEPLAGQRLQRRHRPTGSACSTWSPRSIGSSARTSSPILQEPRAGDVKDSLASLERIEKALGYKPVVPFEEGLRRTVEATIGKG